MAPTPAPDGLADAGRALWDSISDPIDAWSLNPAERAILARACRVADRIADLDEQWDELGTAISTGYNGQDVEHPILTALTKHDALLQRLIGSLKLPDLASGDRPATSSARTAANARWSKPRSSTGPRPGRKPSAESA